jgi:hypothetical protein
VGLDGLRLAVLVFVGFVAAACDGDGRPRQLLYGQRASEFAPVPGSVIARGRVLRRSLLGQRLESCLFRGDSPSVGPDAVVVERVGVDDESLTFANRSETGVFACDGGIDPAGERPPPWCGAVFGELVEGRLLDPRLDVLCRTRTGSPLAYAFVQPVPGAHWVGVDQGGYTELYEVLAGLPVRIASTRGISRQAARATFDVRQFDAEGRELVEGELAAAVAG